MEHSEPGSRGPDEDMWKFWSVSRSAVGVGRRSRDLPYQPQAHSTHWRRCRLRASDRDVKP
jgi:hypothetical protein